jgi:hypothetical protein
VVSSIRLGNRISLKGLARTDKPFVLAAIVSLLKKKLSLTVRVRDEMNLVAVRNPTPEQYLILTVLKQILSPNRASNLLYKQRIRPNLGSATTHKPKTYCSPKRFEHINKGV